MAKTTNSSDGMIRRQFLQRTGTLAAAMTLSSKSPAPARAASDAAPPLVFGIIGCGRRGMQLIEAALRSTDIVFSTVCDVDAARAGAAADLAAHISRNRPAVTGDYRDVFDDPEVKAVIIATPDHWHALLFLLACAAEKDVYIEAPMSMVSHEAQAMVYAARKYKRVVQVGMQYRSSRLFSEAGGIVRSGQLGKIAQTRSWTFARQTPIAAQPNGEPPAGLDYDRWLGPAPVTEYNAARVQNPAHSWDYGGGEAMMWNIHLQDLANAAMRVAVPKSVVAVGGRYGLNDARETPDTLEALFEYETPRDTFMHAYSLRLSNAYAGWGPAALPPTSEEKAGELVNLPARSGVQVFGSEKTLYVGGERLLILPAGANSPIEDLGYLNLGSRADSAQTQPDSATPGPDTLTVSHMKEFADCVRLRRDPSATVEAAEAALFPCVAANIAYRVGRKLYVNPDNQKFFSDPELKTPDADADRLMIRIYRKPYEPPKV